MTVRLTFPQRRALGELIRATVGRTARSLWTRSDVLWRLEERGLEAWRDANRGEVAP